MPLNSLLFLTPSPPVSIPPDASAPASAPASPGIGHYENFPVASLLCPKALRPAITAIYHFARNADDIADEGEASAAERLAQLGAYRADLNRILQGEAPSDRWPGIFAPLARATNEHQLPGALLGDLLSAFEQDVRHTATAHQSADLNELLAYCRLSANPVGRLLLHLYGVHDSASLAQSDHICSALQLINFWQDLSEDLARGRVYLPQDLLRQHRLEVADFAHGAPDASANADLDRRRCQVVQALCADARARMMLGAPLALSVPGRAGWELRLVVQGGLRILDKIEDGGHRSWAKRPTVQRTDIALMLWRAIWMKPS